MWDKNVNLETLNMNYFSGNILFYKRYFLKLIITDVKCQAAPYVSPKLFQILKSERLTRSTTV